MVKYRWRTEIWKSLKNLRDMFDAIFSAKHASLGDKELQK